MSVADDGFDVIISGRTYNRFSTMTLTSFEQCQTLQVLEKDRR